MKNKFNIPVINPKINNARPNNMIWHNLYGNSIRYNRNTRENENFIYNKFGIKIDKYLK